MKYSIVGGNPFRIRGTTTFTSLKVIAVVDSAEEAIKVVDSKYEESGGLLLVIDLKTGLPAEGLPFGAQDKSEISYED